MSEIKPKYVGGEPVCSGQDCDRYGECLPLYEAPPIGDPCIPALRRDRDQLKLDTNKCGHNLLRIEWVGNDKILDVRAVCYGCNAEGEYKRCASTGTYDKSIGAANAVHNFLYHKWIEEGKDSGK